MSLQPGTTIGSYEVTAKIGEGGMGEVYRARDTKLDRDVALKVLPQAFTDDPDRLARFEREAKVLAARPRCPRASVDLPAPTRRRCHASGRDSRRRHLARRCRCLRLAHSRARQAVFYIPEP